MPTIYHEYQGDYQTELKSKPEVVKDMILRDTKRIKNYPVRARIKFNEITSPTKPLMFKLQDLPGNFILESKTNFDEVY